MQINVLDIIQTDGMRFHGSFPFTMKEISFQQGSFPVLGADSVEVEMVNLGDKVVELSAQGRVTVGIPCDRCLRETEVEMPYAFVRKLDFKLSDEDRVRDLDQAAYLAGTELDLDRMVYLELLSNWPMKCLCRQDCAGLCIRCGKDLNEGPCGCGTEPADPRMAAILDLFRDDEEV